MIQATRLSGTPFILNALLIETVETVPDTVITLTTRRKIVVLESADEVVARTVAYLRQLGGHVAATAACRGARVVGDADLELLSGDEPEAGKRRGQDQEAAPTDPAVRAAP